MTALEKTFLGQPYGAYYRRDIPIEDDELTHVGPGTPCGEYLRRFWQPVVHSGELKDLPLRIKILGEYLVVFRDKSDQVGLLELHCSHRGTSLEFGLVSERGIRCCYHGWLYDVDGRVLETPGEPPESTLKDRLCHGAYPVHEYKGLVFAYMGPPDKKPPFPIYDVFEVPGFHLEVGTKNIKHCNWLQIMDNVVDPVHEVFLHARVSNLQFADATGRPLAELADVGAFDVLETPVGIACFETRRIENDIWSRTIEFICPNIAQIPNPPEIPPNYKSGEQQICYLPGVFRWRVPEDDTNTLEFSLVRVPEGQEDKYTKNPSFAVSAQLAGKSRPYEERQRFPADYDVQVGQRPIAIHDLEHLASTDRGVIMMRRIFRQSIQAVQRGDDPKGVILEEGKRISTYGNDTMIRMPPAAAPEEDSKLIRETGLNLAKGYLKKPPVLSGKRISV